MLFNRFLNIFNYVVCGLIIFNLIGYSQNKENKTPQKTTQNTLQNIQKIQSEYQNTEVNPVGAWHLSNFESKNSGKKEHNLRIIAIYEDGIFELYKKVPSQISAKSTIEKGERIFYDCKVTEHKVKKVSTGDWILSKAKEQLTLLSIENAVSKKINDITLTLQAQYDTLIYTYNDSLSFHLNKINK